MKRILMIIPFVLLGCIKYPNDSLVILKMDPCFNHFSDDQNAAFKNAAKNGSHFWDQLGSELRVDTDLSGFTEQQIKEAPTLMIKCDDSLNATTDILGSYWYQSGYIFINTARISRDYNIKPSYSFYTEWDCVFAHELGHSMGLFHVHDPNAVMFPFVSFTTSINDSDIEEFGVAKSDPMRKIDIFVPTY